MKKKRVVLIISAVVLGIILSILVKNFYLYSTYEHGNVALLKNKEGDWVGVFDTWEHGIDERHVLKYEFNSDSSGFFYYEYYPVKVNGKRSSLYSWNSLLPFSEEHLKRYKTKVVMDSCYILYLPSENSLWPDSLYSKYEVRSDSLFIDRKRRKYRYNEEPIWGLDYSWKQRFSRLFYFWMF